MAIFKLSSFPTTSIAVSINNIWIAIVGSLTGTHQPDFIAENKISIYSMSGYGISERTLELLKSKRIDGIFIHLYSVADFMVRHNRDASSLVAVKLPLKGDAYVVYSKKLDPKVRAEVERVFRDYKQAYQDLVDQASVY